MVPVSVQYIRNIHHKVIGPPVVDHLGWPVEPECIHLVGIPVISPTDNSVRSIDRSWFYPCFDRVWTIADRDRWRCTESHFTVAAQCNCIIGIDQWRYGYSSNYRRIRNIGSDEAADITCTTCCKADGCCIICPVENSSRYRSGKIHRRSWRTTTQYLVRDRAHCWRGLNCYRCRDRRTRTGSSCIGIAWCYRKGYRNKCIGDIR